MGIAQHTDLVMKTGMMQSCGSCLGEQFLRSEEQEQENQTVKIKKAPLREGPNFSLLVHVQQGKVVK